MEDYTTQKYIGFIIVNLWSSIWKTLGGCVNTNICIYICSIYTPTVENSHGSTLSPNTDGL